MNHGRVIAATLGAFMALVAIVGWRVVPGIEADLESSVVQALAGRGIQVASITAEGRTINVVGGPESPEERLILAAAARSVPGVRRVRSPLDARGETSWQLDPVRIAQGERDVTVPLARNGELPGSLEAGAPDADAVPDAAPDPASTPDPGRREGDMPESPALRVADEPLPTGCAARLTVLAEGRTLVFARGEATLAQEDRDALEEIAGVLRGCGEWALTIVGYAGEGERSGADAWELADRRAYAVARYLTSRGIEASRLATVAGSAAFDEVGEPRAELYVTGGL